MHHRAWRDVWHGHLIPLPSIMTGKRVFADMATGDYWRQTEEQEKDKLQEAEGRVKGCLNPIILFSDGADMDKFQRAHGEVVMIACGNFRNSVLRKTCARELVAFIPSIQASSSQRADDRVAHANKAIFHHCMGILHRSIRVSKAWAGLRVAKASLLCPSALTPASHPHHPYTLDRMPMTAVATW